MLAIVLLTGVVPPVGIAVVPIGGMVLGGAMTATSLAGRRALGREASTTAGAKKVFGVAWRPTDQRGAKKLLSVKSVWS